MFNFFLKLLSYRVLFLTGDTLVWDRWVWLKNTIKKFDNSVNFVDVGCGAGQFTLGINKLNFNCHGVDVDNEKLDKAKKRARVLNIDENKIKNNLDELINANAKYDCLITLECIEHIMDDKRFVDQCTKIIRKDGYIILTTPNKFFTPITKDDLIISETEDGGHVRLGYDQQMLSSLFKEDFYDIQFHYCSGYLSQKITYLYRKIFKINKYIAIFSILPLRLFQILLDDVITKILKYNMYSICLVARKK